MRNGQEVGTGAIVRNVARRTESGTVTAPVGAPARERSGTGLLALAAMALLGVSQQAQAQSFGTCNSRMFLEQTNTATTLSTLYDVGYATSPFTYTSLGTGTPPRNGIAYNPLDNYIYGIEWGGSSGNELIRVAANGSSTNLGVVSGLPAANYNNGAISPTGEYYVMRGGTTAMYRINLTTREATLITLSQAVTALDLAWHGGSLYGINNGNLVRINPVSGAVTTVGASSPVTNAVSMWSFNNAVLAGTTSSIYIMDTVTGRPTLLSSSPPANNADGASCVNASIAFRADLSVTKTNTPAQGASDLADDTYVPGETRTYTIVVTNSGPFGAQNITVSDPVPAGISAATVSWTCSATSGGARCGAASGTGALNDTALSLPSGAVATYGVTMTVPTTFTGALANTVTITPSSMTDDTDTADNTATDTDTPPAVAQIRLNKALPNGRALAGDQFTLSMAGTGAPAAVTTTGSGTTATGMVTHGTATAGSAYTLSEAAAGSTLLANYTTTWSCTNALAGGQTPSGTGTSFSVTPVANDDLTCTFSNTLRPRVTIAKVSVGGVGTFAFTGTNGLTAQNITTLTAGTAVSAATQTLTSIGASTTITEGVPPSGYTLSGIACTGLGAGGTATPDLATRTVTLDAAATAAGSNITCTFTNTMQTVLRVQKALPSGRAAPGDQFRLLVSGAGTAGAVTTTGSGSTATGMVTVISTVNGAFGVTEVGAGGANLANYTTTWSCTNALPGGQTPSGSGTSFSFARVPGDDLTCTFTNTPITADLRIDKTSSPATAVSGTNVTFTLTVTNDGPGAVTNAQIHDPAVAGLDCTAAGLPALTCTASGSATCPASPTVAGLQTAPGLTIPSLPNGGSVAFGLTCTVTASGF